MAELVLPRRRYKKYVLAGLQRPAWTRAIPWCKIKSVTIYFTKRWLAFPVLLIVMHHVVGQFWLYTNGPFYSLSVSKIILYGDTLLCGVLTCEWLVREHLAELGVRDITGLVLYEGLLEGLRFVPGRQDLLLEHWVESVEQRVRHSKQPWIARIHIGRAVEIGLGVLAGILVLIVEAEPSPSQTRHHFIALYNVPHVLWFAAVGIAMVYLIIRAQWLRACKVYDRQLVVYYVVALLCVLGYTAIVAINPSPYRELVETLRFNTGWIGEWLQHLLFKWYRMQTSWNELPR